MVKEKIGIVGLGMIGGSLALALSEKYDVVGYDIDSSTRDYAEGNVCRIAEVKDMTGCAAVFVCVPVSAMADTLALVSDTLGNSAIITDVASVKLPFRGAAGRYVGGHPMAGTERGGIKAAKQHLFQNAYYCITDEGPDAEKIKDIVRSIGAVPLTMTAEEHDRAVAAFSHTPHAVAYALVTAATGTGESPIAGSGFLDTTRIAKSSEGFWTEVFKLNRDNVSRGIKGVIAELEAIDGMLGRGDYVSLEAYIRAARARREALDRVDLGGEALYVDLVDRVGEFERVTGAVSRAGLNMKSIALIPGREGAKGCLRLEFESASDRLRAEDVLRAFGKDN